jgi:hypothetical protein
LPTYSGESLYLIKKPTERNDISKAAEAVKALSTMEGITYYSNRRKQIEVLYPRCCLIDNPVNRNRIPDKIGTIPEDETFYLFQTDNSLGDCVYSVNFWQMGAEVLVTLTNLDAMKLFVFYRSLPKSYDDYICRKRYWCKSFTVHAGTGEYSSKCIYRKHHD